MEKVLGQLNNPKRRLKECTLFAEKWPEINQVILHGLEEMVAQEVLETYFRDEEKSGSHTFADVTLKGKGIAVVTLQGRQGTTWSIYVKIHLMPSMSVLKQ